MRITRYATFSRFPEYRSEVTQAISWTKFVLKVGTLACIQVLYSKSSLAWWPFIED